MKASKPVAFVVLAFLIGGAASQLPFAFADSSANPLQSIWDAISALSNRQEDLQAQIDELRANIEDERTDLIRSEGPLSEASITLELEGREQPSGMLMHLIASNAGPDNAVGVKVTLFYEMPLFDIQSMNGEQCEDQSRGIIQCFIGTIGPDEEHTITITADAKSLDEESNIVADISSITTDTDPGNNHAELQFVTGDFVRVDDSEPLPVEDNDEPEVSDDEQQEPDESNNDDSQTDSDEAEIVGNNTQDDVQNNTNSTQSNETEPESQPSDEEQQQQGSEDESNSGQEEENVNDKAEEEETQDEASESEEEGEQEESSGSSEEGSSQ